jgi:hypothetical protein
LGADVQGHDARGLTARESGEALAEVEAVAIRAAMETPSD